MPFGVCESNKKRYCLNLLCDMRRIRPRGRDPVHMLYAPGDIGWGSGPTMPGMRLQVQCTPHRTVPSHRPASRPSRPRSPSRRRCPSPRRRIQPPPLPTRAPAPRRSRRPPGLRLRAETIASCANPRLASCHAVAALQQQPTSKPRLSAQAGRSELRRGHACRVAAVEKALPGIQSRRRAARASLGSSSSRAKSSRCESTAAASSAPVPRRRMQPPPPSRAPAPRECGTPRNLRLREIAIPRRVRGKGRMTRVTNFA